MKLSDRVSKIKPSPTLAITQKANELKAKGEKIISLSVGEPDFDTPEHVKQQAIKAIKEGKTKYTAVDGIAELKIAVQNKFKKENNLNYRLDEIIVSTGGKQVLYNIFQASINEGDEVIIPAPYWVSYPDMVSLAGGKSVIVECPVENGFKITPHQLSLAITEKTKWVIINSPGNPSGALYTKAELAALAEVLKQNPHVSVVSDDIYEHIIFDEIEFYNIAEAEPLIKDRVFVMNGVSKAYSMTGWRIGYGAGDASLVKAMKKIQSQSTSNPSSISQYAALEALSGPQDSLKMNSTSFEERRNIVYDKLNNIDGIECPKPYGAFYVFPSIKKLLSSSYKARQFVETSADFASLLLEEEKVAVVPGSAFGLEGHIRISTAASKNDLLESMKRIQNFCNSLVKNN